MTIFCYLNEIMTISLVENDILEAAVVVLLFGSICLIL